jgi:hypothetical protein
MKHLFILLTIILISCNFNNEKSEADKDREDQISRSKTQTLGDTLKITYEFHGDTIIKHQVDLKGSADDGWDASFTVKSLWTTKHPTDLKCRETLTLKQDKMNFIFCYDDVFRKIFADMAMDYVDSLYLNDIKNELVKYRRREIDTLSADMFHFTFRLVQSIDFSTADSQTKSKANKIRIEQYNTGFSGGHNYYLIGDKKDTLARFFVNEWMR